MTLSKWKKPKEEKKGAEIENKIKNPDKKKKLFLETFQKISKTDKYRLQLSRSFLKPE